MTRVFGVVRLLLGVAASTAAVAPAGGGPQTGQFLKPRQEAKIRLAPVDSEGRELPTGAHVVRSQEEWDALAASLLADDDDDELVIDYSKRTVIAVAYTSVPASDSQGEFEVPSVRIGRRRGVVLLRRVRVASSVGCAFETVSYFTLRVVSIPKTDVPIVFKRRRPRDLHLDCR